MKRGLGIFLTLVGVLCAIAYHGYCVYQIWTGSGTLVGIIALCTPPISTMIVSGVILFSGIWWIPLVAIAVLGLTFGVGTHLLGE